MLVRIRPSANNLPIVGLEQFKHVLIGLSTLLAYSHGISVKDWINDKSMTSRARGFPLLQVWF